MNRRSAVALASSIVVVLLISLAFLNDLGKKNLLIEPTLPGINGGWNKFSPNRKLLLLETPMKQPEGIITERCYKSDLRINQGPTPPLPNGIPTYTVEIVNMCVTGCNISNIHLKCGWFSSVRLINPTIFKRLSYDDCLVNDGNPLVGGATMDFQYANTFMYPLSVSSLVCT
ncbi:TPD1 protein homolog 1-like [Carica papaya]|uniref:TPD1 protein homolog 1-like n=1 Tax=Carica papaya TaxID=3649 RepID=UPI000B8D11DE|nr:TPD1 protein homolog 1-like [Carica papaya]XP_021908953.1 TPD1 protein homolog 1-like [Carica papaya]